MKGVPTTAAMLMLAVTIFGVTQGLPLAAPSPEDAHPVIPLGQGPVSPQTAEDSATLITADESKDSKKLDEGAVDVAQKATHSSEKISKILAASPEESLKERTIISDPILQTEAEPKAEEQLQDRREENKVSDDIIIPAAAELPKSAQPEKPEEIVAVEEKVLIKEEPVARSEESIDVNEQEPATLIAEEEKLKIDEEKDPKAIVEVAHEAEQTANAALKERTISTDVIPEKVEHVSDNIQEPISIAEHINRDGKLSEESKEPKELEEEKATILQTETKSADEAAAPATKAIESKPEEISPKKIYFSETNRQAEGAPIAGSEIGESKVAEQESPVAVLASESEERSRTVSDTGLEEKTEEAVKELRATKGEEIIKESVLLAETTEEKEKEKEINKEEDKLVKEDAGEVAKDQNEHEALPQAVKLEGENPTPASETSQESSEESSEEDKSGDKIGNKKPGDDSSQEDSQEKSEQGSKKIS